MNPAVHHLSLDLVHEYRDRRRRDAIIGHQAHRSRRASRPSRRAGTSPTSGS